MRSGADLDDGLSPLEDEALDWIVRLTSGEATRADAEAFARWRARGPAHELALREAAAFRQSLRTIELPSLPEAEVLALHTRPRLSRRALVGGGGALAASLVGWLVARPPLGLWPSLAELTADHHTSAGERRSFAPASGVTVELNGRSALSMADRGRGVRLIDGEAFVQVDGAAAKPFLIAAGDIQAWTHAGGVNVATSARVTCVTCVSGGVEGRAAGRPFRLGAGQQLRVRPGGGARLVAADPQIATAWRHDLLIFRKAPLADVVEAVNRYRPGKIILADGALADRPISGMFHTRKIDSAVGQIQQLLHLNVTYLPGDVAVMG